ncbi:MAG: hypothetical protein Q9M25_03105 [Mariprofundaceae bacterium]|nr:hypothetical protein [Mariprofundaceae bacterium]
MARTVFPGIPHHVIQRGERRMQVFQNGDDYRVYIDLIRRSCRKDETAIWAYSLVMPRRKF